MELPSFLESIREKTTRFLEDNFSPNKGTILTLLAMLVGILTALSGCLFIWTLRGFRQGMGWMQNHGLSLFWILLVMAAAGAVVGWITEYWAVEARGSGIPEVMESVIVKEGRIRPRVMFAKFIASALTIGVGGSAGREGPIVHIGASIGSFLGQWKRVSSKRIRILAACGAAGGIAATFNAPIAGTIFALEVILGSFSARYFGVVVLCAVSSSVISQSILGRHAAFQIPHMSLHHMGELLIYALLAVCAAFVAVAFSRSIFWVGQRFQSVQMPSPLRAALGMVAAGLLAHLLGTPQVLGAGLGFIGKTISTNFQMPWMTLLLLLLVKILASAFTLGSGNSGGVFAPTLFVGALLGGLVGSVAHALWPAMVPQPAAYAVVGMAAVFAGAAHAPMTTILMVVEMSGDYGLILPLMLATVLSNTIAQRWMPDSVYAQKLKERGISVREGRVQEIMDSLTVGEVMDHELHVVSTQTTIAHLSDVFAHTHSNSLMVLDEKGHLWGVVSLSDLKRAVARQLDPQMSIEHISTPASRLAFTHPEATIGAALEVMGRKGFRSLPVVESGEELVLRGVVERRDLIQAYEMGLTRHVEVSHRTEFRQIHCGDGHELVEIVLAEGDFAIGRSLKELRQFLPHDCVLVSIARREHVLIPHGYTLFEEGDQISAFLKQRDVDDLFEGLKQGIPFTNLSKIPMVKKKFHVNTERKGAQG